MSQSAIDKALRSQYLKNIDKLSTEKLGVLNELVTMPGAMDVFVEAKDDLLGAFNQING